jgi:SNF2 family DNA or RNA helicase
MNLGNECYLIYDKFGGTTHSFKNPLTTSYNIKDLFENRLDDPSTEYMTGNSAIIRFNQKFGEGNFKLPDDLNHDIISIHIFSFKDENECDIIITIVGIFVDKLAKYYQTYNNIPDSNFIINACRYHISYEKAIFSDLDDYGDVVKKIVEKVIVPDADIMDPIIDHPAFIKKGKKLYDYQRRSIKWMYDTEINKKKLHYGNNYKFEIEIGPLVFDIISKSLVMKNARDYVMFKGGALIDEVGLGKTIQMLTLCILNPTPVNELSYVDTDHNMLKSRATLIICPNQLCGQWTREIAGMINRQDLRIVNMLTKSHFDKYTYQDLLDADFVIISYNFIGNNCLADKYTKTLSTSKSYHKSTSWDDKAVDKVLKTMAGELANNPVSLFQKEPVFPLIFWHRIIIDEFHEVYTVNKYSYVKNLIPHLKGTYKWIVTGTPFDKGTECFYKMFDFSVDYTNTLKQNIINVQDIKDHMTKNFFRRNTKKSVDDEFKLPELKEKIIWLRFTHTERMMYNAYLTDPNVDRFSEIVRQICCHPKIADEIKGILSNCKTLDDIEKSMVSHYKSQYEFANKVIKKCEKSIAKTERRILIAEYKRQRQHLRKQGYRVKIDLPDFKFQDEVDVFLDVPDLKENNNLSDLVIDDDNNNNDDLNLDDLNLDDLNLDNLTDDDDNKPVIVINNANQANIMNIIKNQLKAHPSQTIITLNETLKRQNERYATAVKICDGKKASYNFFNNMLERIKKANEKAKIKYEKLLEKNHRKDEQGSDYGSDHDSESGNESDDDSDSCGICMCEISGEDVGVTKCGHIFCYDCLKTSVHSTSKCPVCNTPQKITDISMISFEKPVFTVGNSEILKNKLELINKVGTKLTNLIYYLNSIPDHVIIFSQWDSLLRKVGDVLCEHGIKNVFCRGNVWTRDKAIREFSSDDKIKVIMLSSESAASGTNLTKASKVILLDPVSGNYEYRRNMEWQAIGRAYRLGQQQKVEIVRFIIKDTVEEDIYRANKTEDAKQKTQLNISEVTDETIVLTDDKLKIISEAVKKANVEKDAKNKIKKEKLEKKKAPIKIEKNIDTQVIKKNVEPWASGTPVKEPLASGTLVREPPKKKVIVVGK